MVRSYHIDDSNPQVLKDNCIWWLFGGKGVRGVAGREGENTLTVETGNMNANEMAMVTGIINLSGLTSILTA